MEIGAQIKALRTRRGVTQETLAEKLNVSPQAVSKWERGTATPDIQLLPAISAYFGVSIDELFALSDDTRLERIRNMLWDERVLNPATVEREREFLLEKGRREPDNGGVFCLLAEMENQLAEEHKHRAADYAKEGLRREPTRKDGHVALITAMNGAYTDWCAYNHHELIDWYKEFVAANPDYSAGYLWLLDQLLADGRLGEAEWCLEQYGKTGDTFHILLHRGQIAWQRGEREKAWALWKEMCEKYPNDWFALLWMGDLLVKEERYEEAKACYRKALDVQEPPRYTDGATSIAHVCEIQGDYAGAIAAHEEEMNILRTDWNTTDGEQIDQHRREIARLRARMK